MAPRRSRKRSSPPEIKAEEALAAYPGTQGDTLKVVQNLPGVARASFGSGQLVVWGAAPQDTRMPSTAFTFRCSITAAVCAPYSLGDLVRADQPRARRLRRRNTAAVSAAWSRSTRASLRPTGVHGFVAADVIDSSAMLEEHAACRASTRSRGSPPCKSYLDLLTRRCSPRKTSDDFVPIPDYYDAQLKLSPRSRPKRERRGAGVDVTRDALDSHV